MIASIAAKDFKAESGAFVAAGTLRDSAASADPSGVRRAQLWTEFALIYIGLPLLMRVAVFDYRVPLF
jgi:hypothetical protein